MRIFVLPAIWFYTNFTFSFFLFFLWISLMLIMNSNKNSCTSLSFSAFIFFSYSHPFCIFLPRECEKYLQIPLGPSHICGLTLAWNFFTFHSALDIDTFLCYALFQNVLHCLKQMLSPFDLFLSLAVPLSQVYIPCRTAIVLANEEIDYCYWNTISDSPRDGKPARFCDSTYLHSLRVCHHPLETTHFSCELPPNSVEYKMLRIPECHCSHINY